MLGSLSPARRRLWLVVAALAVLGVVAAAVALVAGRDEPAAPVAQGQVGPVLLLPGYGGTAAGLDPLAAALREEGRVVEIVAPPGDGRGDLRDHAALVAEAAREAVAGGAPSVDVVGYSAGGLVARLFVAELGGDEITRRVLTLASPHHGTQLADAAAGLGGSGCPEGCRQLRPDSEVVAALNRGDETPSGPQWAALWTVDDQTVVPPTSGRLEGAVSFGLQDVCPGLVVGHAAVPTEPTVVRMVVAGLGTAPLAVPGPEICRAEVG